MSNFQLSVVIPSRQEMFLSRTIQDIIANSSEETEVIVVLDGKWSDPPIADHPRVNLIYVPESIGQRAATNLGVKLSRAKYVAKCDAHCAFDKDFDLKMIEVFKKTGDNVTMCPVMKNLHAFSWNCRSCNWKLYQGPTPEKCGRCGKTTLRKKMIWQPRAHINSTSYCFDAEPHFQYFEDYKHRPEYIKDKAETGITETMSLQGSFFMCTREKYWELKLCDEEFGSWGSQGLEVACKTWLSGGRVLVNHKCWYAHMFRTKGGTDFGFPYPQSGRQVSRAKQYAKKLLYENKWPKQIYPSSWLLEKFAPVPGWSDFDRAELAKVGIAFTNLQNKFNGILGVVSSIPSTVTNHTTPVTTDGVGQEMTILAPSLPGFSSSDTITK